MDKNLKIKLPSTETVLSSDRDVFIDIELQNNSTTTPIDLFEKIVSNYEIYLQERRLSTLHRIYGNINLIASNVLCNLDGEQGYEGVEIARNYNQDTDSFEKTEEEVLFNDKGFYKYYKNTQLCEIVELEPTRSRYDLRDKDEWKIYVTFPAKKNLSDIKFNGILIQSGIALMEGGDLVVDGKLLSFFICPLTHNLNEGESINIYNQNGFVKKCTVYKVGKEDNTYKKNVFMVDELLPFSSAVSADKYFFKKIIGDTESEYYSRWFQRITETEFYDAFKTSFSKNIFADTNYSFIFNESIDILPFTDYLNRPITELYVSVIKNSESAFWGKTLSAINTYYSNINYDFNMVYEGGPLAPVEEIFTDQTYYFGDIVEYNAATIQETKLNYAVHIFNTQNRIDNNLIESNYYIPHYKMDVNLIADYISKEDGYIDIPAYASQYDGLYQWRNIEDNLNLPYLNLNHYVYYNLNVFIRRQDPCNRYAMADNALILGKCIETDIQKIINPDKIC